MSDPHRDAREHDIFELAQEHSIPCAGICRGAQFLNVKCGGRMFQHVDNHAIGGTHSAIDVGTALTVEVTSTHHQMMIPDEDYAMYILTVPQSRCSHKDYVDADGELQIVTPKAANRSDQDIEAVFYPDQRVFCFQPHPEYAAGEACREYYFAQIESLLFFDNTRRNNWSVNHDEGQSNNVKISDSLDDLLVAAVDPEEED
jgi:gamma-glutamyl-gamma-aminobutyrate hydrolase PuuD